MPGKRGGFVRDALHQVAIADQRIGEMVNQLVFGSVKPGREEALGKRESNRVRCSLPKRASRCFDTWSIAVFRVAGSHRAPLSEILQLFQRQVVAAEVQHGVDEHGAMPR